MEVDLDAEVKACVAEALALNDRDEAALDASTALLGVHPDFNSMAVLVLLTSLEERLGMSFADDIRLEAFTTVGTLIEYLRYRK